MASGAQEAQEQGNRRHLWLIPLVLFGVSQLIFSFFLWEAKDRQEAIPAGDGNQYFVKEHVANPPWDDYVSGWNGQAYRSITEDGYPTELPKNPETGATEPNPWAWFPLWPALVKLVMMVTGLSYGYSALPLALFFGFAGTLLLYRTIYCYSKSRWIASLAVASVALWPAAGLFQLGYAEALAFFLLVFTFRQIESHRYLWAIPSIMLLGLTRPMGPPDTVLILVHGLAMAYGWMKSKDLRLRELPSQWRLLRRPPVLAYLALCGASALAAVEWALIGYLVTGEAAYFETRSAYGPSPLFAWFREAFTVTQSNPLGTLPFILLIMGWAVALLWLKQARSAYPLTLRLWAFIASLYIFSFTTPVGNEQRYLLLSILLFPFTSIPKNRLHRFLYFGCLGLLLLVAIYLQWNWVNTHWVSEVGVFRKNV